MAKALGMAWDWITENFIILIVIMVIIGIIGAVVFAPPRQYLQVPVELCRAVNTGATRQQQMPVQHCASYDKNGVCTAPFTTYNTYTEAEVRVTCDYVEWRSQ